MSLKYEPASEPQGQALTPGGGSSLTRPTPQVSVSWIPNPEPPTLKQVSEVEERQKEAGVFEWLQQHEWLQGREASHEVSCFTGLPRTITNSNFRTQNSRFFSRSGRFVVQTLEGRSCMGQGGGFAPLEGFVFEWLQQHEWLQGREASPPQARSL